MPAFPPILLSPVVASFRPRSSAAPAVPLRSMRELHCGRSYTFRRTYVSGGPATAQAAGAEMDRAQSLTQRLKVLFRKHGWTALSVYLLLSAVDFGLTFLMIYAVGADRVREAEDWVLDTLGWRRKDGEPGKVRKAVEEWKDHHPRISGRSSAAQDITPSSPKRDHSPLAGSQPQRRLISDVSSTNASTNDYSAVATTAVLAYAIHKTLLLPVRVGITPGTLAGTAVVTSSATAAKSAAKP
ncbi:DUF1279 super [Microbotryomycetes sp. JL201]|nr:DUF1279 super [Microbotryomycetes sp. JL201]